MSFPPTHIISLCLLLLLSLHSQALNLTLLHQHPNPEEVVQQVHRSVNASVSRRLMLSSSSSSSCLTGNPIDDCWRCDPNWATPTGRQRLADCAIGFGRAAMGGKGGKLYVVTDSSDPDPVTPKLGTLRYAVLQEEPLWIVFASDMTIKLRYELIINDYKTIDGRGANVHITGGGCITIQYVSNIIIHSIHVHDCVPAGNANVRSSPTHVGYRSKSDGDGISIAGASNIWIDHCFLAHCTDGLIDAVLGSTAITISNNHFERHNDVMLLGTNNGDILDSGMQVTIAFNHFGQGLVQRMPRCRRGYIHIVNNDITYWEIYAVGGSDNPTINSQGNRYIAPANSNAKEVTKRVEAGEKEWMGWNWRSEGDIMVNGAFFVPSGQGVSAQYTMAASMEPKSAGLIDQLTGNAGVFGDPSDRVSYGSDSGGGGTSDGGSSSGSSSAGESDLFGMIFGGGSSSSKAATAAPPLSPTMTLFLSLVIIAVLYSTNNHGALLSSSLTLLSV